MRLLALCLALGLASLAACGDDDDGKAPQATGCTPGASAECTCPGGSKSGQVCNASGDSYGECACGSAGAGGSGQTGLQEGEKCSPAEDTCAAGLRCSVDSLQCLPL